MACPRPSNGDFLFAQLIDYYDHLGSYAQRPTVRVLIHSERLYGLVRLPDGRRSDHTDS
jgi:hypothetical protein